MSVSNKTQNKKSQADLDLDLDGYDYYKTIEEFSEFIRLNPYIAEAYFFRGESYYQLEQTEQAIHDFEKVLNLKPDSEFAKEKLQELRG